MVAEIGSIDGQTIKDVWDDPGRKWPNYVYVETSNFCNAYCLSCLNHRVERERYTMTLDEFKFIADKVKANGMKIGAMFCFGEPLTDDTLFEKYEYGNKIGVFVPGHVGLNTNVSLLTEEKYDAILAYTPNIILSFFNVGEEYERLTGGLDWHTSYNNALKFISYRDKHKPRYPIFIGCNAVAGNDFDAVKAAFKGKNVYYARDAELRWGGSVITGVIDRMVMYNEWRCDGYKGTIQIKPNGDCEMCAYDIIKGETKFANMHDDSWEEIERKFREAWKEPQHMCTRCDFYHKAKQVIGHGFKKPHPLPDDWYTWQTPHLKEGEDFVD